MGEVGPLYTIRTDGTGRQKLCNDERSWSVNVVGDWIYYSNGSDDYKLYSIRTDGTGRQKLIDDMADYINVVGERIYYYSRNEFSHDSLYSIRIDGSDRRLMD